ncbi:hypothetical protein [Spirillospora albida]|uniref:hypothetical protein n=1 Tax=Spirillospora albida TaxID=58123 RepID=UPI0004BEADC0|nr:hypothetical protein [Spirillospora albida]
MLAVQLGELLDGAPEGVGAALDVIAGFDEALARGLGRLGEDGSLQALAGALAGSPLGPVAAEAAEKIAIGGLGDERLTAMAAGRSAVFGAVHDALLARLDGALGRERIAWEDGPAGEPAAANLLSGCRSWLGELAIAGWRGVDHDLVSASDPVVEALLAEPRLRRLAVLLDGFAAELRASSPVATMERLPVRRWADLWARALLLARGAGSTVPAGTVSGRLLILGAEVHEHATAVQVRVHGILEGGDGPRLVRAGVAAAKVDTITGPAVWNLLGDHPALLAALAEHRGLDVQDMPVAGGGDLVWDDGRANAGEPADPFATARVRLAEASAPAVPPLERHPVRIAEPVLLEGYTVKDGKLELDGHSIELDLDRLPPSGPLTPQLVAASTSCIGLVRWDDRWRVQPLAVQATVRKKPVEAHNGDWAQGPTDPKVVKAEARSGDVVAVLRERAGRLLRK